MDEIELSELRARLQRLEAGQRRWARRAWAASAVSAALMAVLMLAAAGPAARAGGWLPADSVLRVRGLVVVDSAGVERVVIGAPVPDPLIYGRRSQRLGTTSGILLFDSDGNERSGYLTSEEVGEVFFTLDAAARQQALFLANASGGANLSMWDMEGNGVQLSAVGGPSLGMRRRGQSVLSLPDSAGGGR